ncbi:MAG: hypothetical protein ING84_18720 [Cytophagales bacterium]|nr:hypothetical protein [Cytophagales bacterium]MCA6369040.1 hypothetical protein [Cytophagales bacterium]MCA6373485.1 hypothetical protein [Cytophagales bacterium]MCA6375511.1 hypothetical protein [Cytophagales bacterium]MCA6385336.1 hypothetical protein [Cytophagales bacterium]
MRVISSSRGSGDMRLGAAQTSTGKKTFNGNATNAGFNFGSFAVDPATTVNGDSWYSSSEGVVKLQLSAGRCNVLTNSPGVAIETGELYAAANAYQYTQSDFFSVLGTKTLGRSTNVFVNQTLTVNGISPNIDFTIIAKGQGQIIFPSTLKGPVLISSVGGGVPFLQHVNLANTITYAMDTPYAAIGASVGGFVHFITLPSTIPNNSTVSFEIDVMGITPSTGATGYALKYLCAFRKDNSGIWTQIGITTTSIAVADAPYVPTAPVFSILGTAFSCGINFTGAITTSRSYTISMRFRTGQ